MIVHVKHKESNYTADLNAAIEIGIPIQRNEGVSCFSIANAQYKVYEDQGFIGSIAQGSGCNLETITFTPHGNGTHSECLGHISKEVFHVNDCIKDKHYVALVLSFSAKQTTSGQQIVDFSNLNFEDLEAVDALVIRTLPNANSKRSKDYSGENTPFISLEDMQAIVTAGIKHLILDLPSVDPEWDDGALAAHHIFWQYPENPRKDASITEFAYVDDSASDGLYLLKLNIAPFQSDAAPSRPTLYPLVKE